MWLQQLVRMLDKYEKVVDVVGFLGQIKQKVDECSRCFTAIWVIEMLFQTYSKHEKSLKEEFLMDAKQIKAAWDTIYNPIKEKRQELICSQCIDYFYAEYKGAQNVISEADAQALEGNFVQKWNKISKMCADQGLMQDEEYQKFLSKLMNEMVKY